MANTNTTNDEVGRQIQKEKAKRQALLEETMRLTEQRDALQLSMRKTQFAALAERWQGDIKTHVGILEHLAETVGEDSELFASYLRNQQAAAAQIQASKEIQNLMETVQ